MQEYSSRHNISFPHAECGTSCTASIIGFGFNTSCSVTEFESLNATNQAFDQPIFVSSTSLYPIGKRAEGGTWYEDMGMRFNVTYRVSQSSRETTDANGTYMLLITRLRSHICNLTGGSVEYKVRLSSQTISLASDRSEDRFVQAQVLAGPGTYYHHSTIGGFEYAASYMFSSKAVSLFRGARSSISLTGALANEMIRGVSVGTSNETFDDPMAEMLDGIRDIAFRTAVRAGRDQLNNVTAAQQMVAFKGQATHSIYVTDFRYMFIATALSVASVLATSLLFFGWWQLGRTVSLSPLEIAKAFDAPILSQVGSNVDLADNKHLGHAAAVRVQYGVRIEDMGYGGGQLLGQRRRLVVGQAGWVGRPVKGDVYGY
ncbi:hypothetical protein IQ06DRAFT_149566 [Phaeosphaeriaceae sp. SRC1lsM3a]|nr:hypothetical protein IQ06DRAFT_149566 [Stagonospora sp. SRC1lsM3a]